MQTRRMPPRCGVCAATAPKTSLNDAESAATLAAAIMATTGDPYRAARDVDDDADPMSAAPPDGDDCRAFDGPWPQPDHWHVRALLAPRVSSERGEAIVAPALRRAFAAGWRLWRAHVARRAVRRPR